MLPSPGPLRPLALAFALAACVPAAPSSGARLTPPPAPVTHLTAAPSPLPSAPVADAPLPAPAAEPPAPAAPPLLLRKATGLYSSTTSPLLRVKEAQEAKLAEVRGLFAAAGVRYPPAQMLLRGFKRERVLELWAASGPADPLARIAAYEICAASGTLGPKRREGDGQVPEGAYTLIDYNPSTPFYLALHVGYPNTSDRILGDKHQPGSEIMIHGKCASRGCLAMSDERAQELWLATTALRYAGGVVHVHLFPTRDMEGLLAAPEGEAHRAFWENLRGVFDHFERTQKIPRLRVDREGRYHVLG